MAEGLFAGITFLGLTGVTLLLVVAAVVVGLYAAYLGYTKHYTNRIMHAILGLIFGPFYLGYLVYERKSIKALLP
jgi:hypothetical protein